MRARRLAQKLALAAALAALLAVIALVAFIVVTPPPPGAGKRALIIDSLYEWTPNEGLLSYLEEALGKAGYSVDVIKGSAATVDAFRNLTSYDLVVIRCHGGYLKPGESLGAALSPTTHRSSSLGRCTASASPSPASATSRG
jgi:hypothetical protein